MKTERIHIDNYATALLSDRGFCNKEYRKYVDNCYILQNVEGNINPDVLNAVIRKAKWDRKIRSMLVDILSYVNENSISDENFRMLLCFSPQKRNSYLEAIGHVDLAFVQMQIIAKITSSFEAFAWLFDQICKYDCFKDEDMLQLLRDSSDISIFGVQSCIDLVCPNDTNISKLRVAKLWVKKLKQKE